MGLCPFLFNCHILILDKVENGVNISPKHQQFVQQCEDKLVAICNERGIIADSPQDFKNIAAAIATKGIIEQGMDKVEKATIDGLNFYIGSYRPIPKLYL